MIAREIEQEKIRRLENSLIKTNWNNDTSHCSIEDNGVPFDHEMDFLESSAPSSLSTPAGL